MDRQEFSFWLAAVVVYAIVFALVAALAFGCTGPVDSAPGQPTPTAAHYEYLPCVPRAATPTPTPRPTMTPAPTARPTATN